MELLHQAIQQAKYAQSKLFIQAALELEKDPDMRIDILSCVKEQLEHMIDCDRCNSVANQE